jgi:hypothetical protein
MKNNIIAFFSVVGAAALLGLTSCEVKKTEEGNLPKLKVEEEGNLPKYEVKGPKIETGTKEVEVPTLEITPASELPDEDEPMDSDATDIDQ